MIAVVCENDLVIEEAEDGEKVLVIEAEDVVSCEVEERKMERENIYVRELAVSSQEDLE